MSRIGDRFASLREGGSKALIAFVTAGDPSLDRTVDIACDLAAAGADVIELGVPFSDPLADGPVIQRASDRAARRTEPVAIQDGEVLRDGGADPAAGSGDEDVHLPRLAARCGRGKVRRRCR